MTWGKTMIRLLAHLGEESVAIAGVPQSLRIPYIKDSTDSANNNPGNRAYFDFFQKNTLKFSRPYAIVKQYPFFLMEIR